MRKEAQKGRPPPLKIQQQQQQQQQQHNHGDLYLQPHMRPNPHELHRAASNSRPHPLIVHTFSPEVIQTDVAHFMKLVQSLTGASSCSSSALPPPFPKRARLMPPQEHARHCPAPSLPDSASTALRQQEMQQLSELPSLPHFPHLASLQALPSPIFDFSPSVLPSPSAFISRAAEFPPLRSPAATPFGQAGSAPLSLPYALPSPGPLTAKFFADLPALSPPDAYPWSPFAASAGAVLSPVFSPRRRLGLLPHTHSNF